jgi:sec-independent protein translocase protein TatB
MTMFDIGFWEITLFAVIALLVLGPERLPGLARTAGLWVGKARRAVSEVRDEVERELHVEEIKQSIRQDETTDQMKNLADRVKSINTDLQKEIRATPEDSKDPPPPSNSPIK